MNHEQPSKSNEAVRPASNAANVSLPAQIPTDTSKLFSSILNKKRRRGRSQYAKSQFNPLTSASFISAFSSNSLNNTLWGKFLLDLISNYSANSIIYYVMEKSQDNFYNHEELRKIIGSLVKNEGYRNVSKLYKQAKNLYLKKRGFGLCENFSEFGEDVYVDLDDWS